ncbi:hypothetical protein B0H17DRAFT_1135743 [Mycena rosella]|uniref:Uncharacterized protein n=1 Tax=Mycena rosella TaxID=1033263 RepID=A0AAD7DCF5_MYCRO|nr:hypothetical protein B0H17DRAFT_1135743 [Mycena rosella]
MYRVIEALIVLHNIAIDVKDKPDQEWSLEEDIDQEADDNGDREVMVYDVEGEVQAPARKTDDWLKEQGRAKRDSCLLGVALAARCGDFRLVTSFRRAARPTFHGRRQ